jgi:hypothetical protein
LVKLLAIDRDSHALRGFIDLDQEIRVGGLTKDKHQDDGGGERGDKTADTHKALQR